MEAQSKVSERSFVKGLLASLSLFEFSSVPTVGNRHQRAFNAAIQQLEDMRLAGETSTDRMPRWYPAAITGMYEEFDTALLALQNIGITRAVGPYFMSVEIRVSEERARTILDDFSPEEQALFTELGSVFIYEANSHR